MRMSIFLELGAYQGVGIETTDTNAPTLVPGAHPGTLEEVDPKMIEMVVRGVDPGYKPTRSTLHIGEDAQRKLIKALEANLAGDPEILRSYFNERGGPSTFETFVVNL